MSATFKNSKKKAAQIELRKIMNEHKGKNQKDVKKIDSPLAKYNELGQLTCVLCKSIVRSEAVWVVHVNAKQHKQNVELAKKLKERTENFTKPLKRPLSPPRHIPEKKPKGILKNSTSTVTSVPITNGKGSDPSKKDGNLPSDFFVNKNPSKDSVKEASTSKVCNEAESMEVEEALPEGFFDDPKLDAKARHQEYKDPVEEEWEKFMKAIKEADDKSAAIIAEDQEEATNERQIDEIDEQMKNLSKVLEMEKKKVEIVAVMAEEKRTDNAVDDEDIEDEDFDEYLDWRAKQSFK